MGLDRLFGVLGTGLRPFDLAYILEKDNAGPATYRGRIPTDFRERNTGVVVYHANRRVAELFAYWEELFHAAVAQDIGQINDQPSLRDALWRGRKGGRGQVRASLQGSILPPLLGEPECAAAVCFGMPSLHYGHHPMVHSSRLKCVVFRRAFSH
jgi:hypothetical protein